MRIKVVLLLTAIIFIFTGLSIAETIPLEWTFSESEIVDGFRLYQRIAGGEYDYNNPVATFAPNSREGTVEINYTEGIVIDYQFVLRSFSGELQSEDSNEVMYPSVGTIPEQPVNLSGGYSKTDELITLFWTQPDDPDGYTIEKWYIFYRLDTETDLTQLAELVVPSDVNPEVPIELETPFDVVPDGSVELVHFTVLPVRRSGVQGPYAEALSLMIDRRPQIPPPGLSISISLPVK